MNFAINHLLMFRVLLTVGLCVSGQASFAVGSGEIIDRLAHCDSDYFSALRRHAPMLVRAGLTVVPKGEKYASIKVPDRNDIGNAIGKPHDEIEMDGLSINGFVDGIIEDDVTRTKELVWGISASGKLATSQPTLISVLHRMIKLFQMKLERRMFDLNRSNWIRNSVNGRPSPI